MSELNPAALPEGAVLGGRYQITRRLSAGGMGAVYECIHLTTRKYRALKVMLPEIIASPGMRQRFELEARVTAEIESDHIVETFDAGVDEATGAPFLVMELLRGEDLDSVLGSRGPFQADQAVAILAQAASALDRTHAAGIVHRDLKPQNLFLTRRDDGSARLKVLDFGIAKVVADSSRKAQQTAVIGTPIYMAPEQTTGDGAIGPPADRYALAHIAYSLLAGDPYWLEEYESLPILDYLNRMLANRSEAPSARAARHGITLPIAFDAWFARATAAAPGERFDSAAAQIEALAAALVVAPPRLSLGTPPIDYDPSRRSASGAEPMPAGATPRIRVGQDAGGEIGATAVGPSQPLDVASGAGAVATLAATSAPLASPAPEARGRRWGIPLLAGAIALFVAALGTTMAIAHLRRESAPATTAALPEPAADGRAAAAPVVVPTVTLGEAPTAMSAVALPSAAALPKTVPSTARPIVPPRPTVTTRSAPPAAATDPTRFR